MSKDKLTKFAWLSIAAAIITITLKGLAYYLTGSVGLLSDALESLVNLAAALIALVILMVASRPPDEDFSYGYTKAEYFSSGIEGALILLAAVSICWTSVERLISPQPIEQIGIGLLICTLASFVNFVVAKILLKAGKTHHSITLEADAHHLMTDVWTSVGVILGVGMVKITGWQRLDPIIAILVGINIIWSGISLVRRSAAGLMDVAIPETEQKILSKVLEPYIKDGMEFHAIRTRQSGTRQFLSMHALVPPMWTVQQGHDLVEKVEADIHKVLPRLHILIHLEPQGDPAAYNDQELDTL
jgi:cation diffusion facilitator family transporter